MVNIEYGGISRERVFPNLPSSWMAVIVPFMITLFLLYFDFMEGYKTNPVLFFAVPILFSLVFMPKDSWKNIKVALSIAMPTLREKLIHISGAVVGGIVGFGCYFILTRTLGIIPLYFLSAEVTGNAITSIAMTYTVIAVGEEVICVIFGKIAANKISERINDKKIATIIGLLIGRAFWSAMHFFSYQGFLGVQTLPLFFSAWFLGAIFTGVAMGFALLIKEREYILLPAITPHLLYDVSVAMHLSMIFV